MLPPAGACGVHAGTTTSESGSTVRRASQCKFTAFLPAEASQPILRTLWREEGAVGLVSVDADGVRVLGRVIEVPVVIVVSEGRIEDDWVELIAFIVGSRNHLEVGSVWMLPEDGCQLCVIL